MPVFFHACHAAGPHGSVKKQMMPSQSMERAMAGSLFHAAADEAQHFGQRSPIGPLPPAAQPERTHSILHALSHKVANASRNDDNPMALPRQRIRHRLRRRRRTCPNGWILIIEKAQSHCFVVHSNDEPWTRESSRLSSRFT
jgi:hypothetical protein